MATFTDTTGKGIKHGKATSTSSAERRKERPKSPKQARRNVPFYEDAFGLRFKWHNYMPLYRTRKNEAYSHAVLNSAHS